MERFESFHHSEENVIQPETEEQRLIREEKVQKQQVLEQKANQAGEIESEKATANFEQNLPQLLDMVESDDLDESHFTEVLHLSSQPSGIDFQDSLSNVETSVKNKILRVDLKELMHDFELHFRKLFEKYSFLLNSTNLSEKIEVTDSLLSKLIPDNTALRVTVRESLKNQESITAKEILVTCIFQDIIWQHSSKIHEDIQNLHSPKANAESQNEQINILVELGIRQKEELSEKVEELNMDDLKSLNTKLTSIKSLEDRQVFLNEFIEQMSDTIGLGSEEYQNRLENLMQDIQGLETLKLTFTKLQSEGSLENVLNDDGTLNTELFTTYYQESTQTVFEEFEAFENIITPLKEVAQQEELFRPSVQELSKDEARENPIINLLLSKNPLIETHFMKENSAIRLHETGNGNREIELVLAKENKEHGLSIKIDEQTGKSTVYVADIKILDTDVTDETTLQRDLNAASANHLILDELNFPYSVFIDQQVDTKNLEGINDWGETRSYSLRM